MAAPVVPPPLLQDGDRLSREEFLRRWEWMPDLKFAELIDGVVYMASPVSASHHFYVAIATGWLFTYAKETPGCAAGVDGTWLMNDSVPQPDLDLCILPEFGGQARVEGSLLAGAPEFAVEVATSSAARDLGLKSALYERSGVIEYAVLLAQKQRIVWKRLVEGRYRAVEPGPDGIFRSQVFPGLWLDEAALWRRDSVQMCRVLDQGLATPEHAEFVRALDARRKSQ